MRRSFVRRGRLGLLVGLVVTWVVLVLAGPAGATTTAVHCDTNSAALQPAINAAISGDTLVIYGTCKGNFSVADKSLTLQGAGAGATLDGQHSGTTLSFTNLCECGTATLSVIGLTITNGFSDDGGGIYQKAGVLHVTNSIIKGNGGPTTGASDGGGVYAKNGTLTVTGSVVSGNSTQYGGGLYLDGIDTTIDASTISGNTAAAWGGGLYTESDAPINVNNSTITQNRAAYGGGTYNDYEASALNLNHTTVSWNQASVDGGGSYNYGSTLSVTSSTYGDNRAAGNGGGIANFADSSGPASLTISSSLVEGNLARAGYGGGIDNAVASGSSATVTIDHTTIGPAPNQLNDGNQAKFGGGIANDGTGGTASVSLQTGASVHHNSASNDGGGVFNTGGGLLTIAPGASVTSNTPDNVS